MSKTHWTVATGDRVCDVSNRPLGTVGKVHDQGFLTIGPTGAWWIRSSAIFTCSNGVATLVCNLEHIQDYECSKDEVEEYEGTRAGRNAVPQPVVVALEAAAAGLSTVAAQQPDLPRAEIEGCARRIRSAIDELAPGQRRRFRLNDHKAPLSWSANSECAY